MLRNYIDKKINENDKNNKIELKQDDPQIDNYNSNELVDVDF